MRRQIASSGYRPRPFVKWAGGKRQILPAVSGGMPESFGRYFEPFLGGGALFFHVAPADSKGGKNGRDGAHPLHISDLNRELVLAYQTIRDRPEDLLRALRDHEAGYRADPESYYYSVRDGYDPGSAGDIDTASRLIFLNKTCFNGLYRVNSRGKFNVPLGRYANPTIADEQNILAVSEILNLSNVHVSCEDFGAVARKARRGDFVYFDPPYMPVSKTASFTKYTCGDFGIEDQRRLADLCVTLDEMGCHVLLSNSDSGVISEMFARDEWTVERVSASRCINSDSGRRLGHTELLIRNY